VRIIKKKNEGGGGGGVSKKNQLLQFTELDAVEAKHGYHHKNF